MAQRHLSAAALTLLLASGNALAQDNDAMAIDDTPHITVVGTAAAEVAPDVAEIRLSVTVEKATPGEAWDACSKLAQDVIDAAKAAGVKPQNIATTHVDLFQDVENTRQPDGTTKRDARGFRATEGLRIRMAELDKIGSMTGALIAKGANTFEGVSFSVAKPAALQDKLRAEAMLNARHQADILAEAASVRLGRLLQVERPDRPAPVRPVVRTTMAGPSTMPVEPGTETLSAEVEATYAIE